MPVGLEETTPLPFPDLITSSVCRIEVKVAVTVWDRLRVTVHGLVPLQPPPLQPLKVEPLEGDAVRVSVVPQMYPSKQSATGRSSGTCRFI